MIFFSPEFRLLDRVLAGVNNIDWEIGKATERDREECFIKTIYSLIEFGYVGFILLLEFKCPLSEYFFNLSLRHKVNTCNSIKRIKVGLLNDHVFV